MKREFETSITARIPESLKLELDKFRLKEKTTINEIVKNAITDYLSKNGK